MEYLCIFALMFLGIFGAVCFVLSICEYFPEKNPKEEYVNVYDTAELEFKVRNALLHTSGDVIVIAEEYIRQSEEFIKIFNLLCKESSRIKLRRKE